MTQPPEPPERRHGLALVASLLLAAAVSGQGAKWSVRPTRLAEGEKPKIDGRLDEPLWADAAKLSPLTQVEPVEGAAPTRKTDARLCYDADYIYVGLHCFDDPKLVRSRLKERDANLDPDDRVEMWFDTFDDNLFAFWFQIGAGGSRGDALIADNGSRFNKSWDGIWYGRASVVDNGWIGEVAIPFKTLAFKNGSTTWGFNLRRLRKANDEEMRWASPRVSQSFFRISLGGALEGITGMRQGLGIDVKPYFKAEASRDRRERKHTSVLGDFGFDFYYRVTPEARLTITYNTDFAETEVDARQVNLTRFPLFFPEKRGFFLEDAGLFEFGPRNGNDLLPFFSRRIGRSSDGETIPILVGSKLTGRFDGWNVGALGTLTDAHGAVDEKALGVVRVSRNVGKESTVGMIATGGRPEEPGSAATAGVDFALGDQRAFGADSGFKLWGYWLASQASGPGGDGSAYGVKGQYFTREWDHTLIASNTDSDFDPKLGFVRRMGVRQYEYDVEYTYRSRGRFIRKASWELAPELTTLTDGSLDSWQIPLQWLGLELDTGDRVSLGTRRELDHPRQDFTINGRVVPAGEYYMTRHSASFDTSDRRVIAAGIDLDFGDFYAGEIVSWTFRPIVYVSDSLHLSGTYQVSDVALPAGGFTTEIYEGKADILFTPDMSWKNLVQYDTASKDMTVQSRYQWILEPGRELFVLGVFGWDRLQHGAPLIPTTQGVTLKFGYTFRF